MAPDFLLDTWDPAGAALVSLLALLAASWLPELRRPGYPALTMGAALVVLTLAVASPLAALAQRYLLSAHMVQHLLLAQVAPPLLLLSLPRAAVARALSNPAAAGVERTLRAPALAWLAGVCTLWVWHIPAVYEAGAASPLLRDATVLLSGLIFWWPIVAPLPEARLGAPAATLYLASACAASTALGIALTFAPDLLYPGYLAGADPYGVRFLCHLLGLTPLVDQQLGGLLMWVPCCLLYLVTVAAVLARWYAAPEAAAA